MTTETITIVVSEKGARVVKRNIEEIGQSASKSANGVDTLRDALKGVAAYFGGRELLRFIDSITIMSTQLRNVTRNTAEYTAQFKNLYGIAQRTGSSMGSIVDTFVRLNSSLPNSIRYTTDLAKVTELLSRGMAASGANTQTASAILTQLTQGLSGNFANAAQELNSLIEGAPLLARIIAEQLGGRAATDLKKFAEAGTLTSKSFLAAVIAAEGAINAYSIPPTIERSWQRIKNAFVEMGAESELLRSTANALADVLDALSKHVDILAKAVTVAAAAWGAYWLAVNFGAFLSVTKYVVGTVTAFVQLAATVRSTAGAVALLNAAFMANPLGLLAAAVATLAAGFYLFSKQTDTLAEQTGRLNKIQTAGLDISMKLAGASGERRKALEQERLQLIKNAKTEVETARVSLNAALSKYDELEKGSLSFTGIIPKVMQGNEIEKRTEALTNAQKALKDLQQTFEPVSMEKDPPTKAALKQAQKDQKDLAAAIRDSWTEQEKQLSKIKELEGMRGIAKTAKDAQDLELAVQRANKELDDMKVAVERDSPLAKAFESLVNQVDDGFRESFRDAFVSGDGGWKSMLEGWKASFKAFLADLAYTALARPIILSTIAGLGTSMGLSTAASAGIVDGIGGTGSSAGMGGLLSNLSSLSNLSGLFGTNQALVGMVNKLGGFLGIGGVGANGPTSLSGMTSFTNGSWGGSLGAGLGGMGGSMLASALFGSKGMGATIGGTLGTIAGSFIPVPVLGPAIGGFLGTAIGGLFGGGKPSDKRQWGGFDFDEMQSFNVAGMTGKKYSKQNADFRDGVLGQAGALAQMLQGTGASTNGSLNVRVGSRDGLWLFNEGVRVDSGSGGDLNKSQYQNFGKDSEAFVEAVLKRVIDQTDGLAETYKTIIDKIGLKDLEKLQEAFGIGTLFESIVNPVDQVAKAIEDINKQFDALVQQATDLGLSSAVFTDEMEKRRQAEIDLIKAQQAGFQSLEAMKSTFDSWLYDQSLSSTSSLSPLQKLTAAQGNFGDLLSRAQGGDYTVTQDLLAAGQQLLQIGQSMYASSTNFTVLEQFVRSSIGQIARELDIPGYAVGTDNARRGWAWVGEEGPELVNFRGGETVMTAGQSAGASGQGNYELIRETAAMRQDIKGMSRQISRLVSKFIVVEGGKQ